MMTFEPHSDKVTPEVQFGVFLLQHLLQSHGARPLDDRQAETLARYVNDLQCKIDDLGDKCDALEAKHGTA